VRFRFTMALMAIVAVTASGIGQAAARGGEKAFVIANYPVEASAKNAVAAKKKALSEGQAAAFRSLLKRIVPVTAYASLKRLESVSAATLLDGMSVRSEQNSSTEYIASLDFVFSADAVRKALRANGVPFIDAQAPMTTLVTVFRPGIGQKPGTSLGEWGAIWKDLDLANSVAPLRISALKPSIHADTLAMIESGDGSTDRILANQYGSRQVVFAIAELNPTDRRLKVVLSGTDAVGKLHLERSYRLTEGDVGYAMEYAAVISQGIIEGRWKAVKARDMGGIATLSGPAQMVVLDVEYGSPREWYDLQSRLQAVPGIEGFRTESVSARNAQVVLRYPGGGTTLARTLAPEGLSVISAGGDRWVLRRGP